MQINENLIRSVVEQVLSEVRGKQMGEYIRISSSDLLTLVLAIPAERQQQYHCHL